MVEFRNNEPISLNYKGETRAFFFKKKKDGGVTGAVAESTVPVSVFFPGDLSLWLGTVQGAAKVPVFT